MVGNFHLGQNTGLVAHYILVIFRQQYTVAIVSYYCWSFHCDVVVSSSLCFFKLTLFTVHRQLQPKRSPLSHNWRVPDRSVQLDCELSTDRQAQAGAIPVVVCLVGFLFIEDQFQFVSSDAFPIVMYFNTQLLVFHFQLASDMNPIQSGCHYFGRTHFGHRNQYSTSHSVFQRIGDEIVRYSLHQRSF